MVLSIDDSLSKVLSRMGICGALLVVALHTQMQLSSDDFCFFGYALWSFTGFMFTAVPMFFGISGFLLVGHCDCSDWWKNALLKRIRTLVIPYYVWLFILSAVRLVVSSICPEISGQNTAVGLSGMSLVVYLLGCDFWHCNGVVWYIRSLFFFILISPLFVWLFRRSSKVFGFVALAILFFFAIVSRTSNFFDSDFFRFFLEPTGFFAFAIGIALRMKFFKIRCGGWMYAAWFFMYTINILCRKSQLSVGIGFVLLMLNVMVIYDGCRKLSVPDWLTHYSFPIYLIHYVVIDCLLCAVLKLSVKDSLYSCACMYPVRICFVLAISVFFARIIRKNYFLNSLLFGGRT